MEASLRYQHKLIEILPDKYNFASFISIFTMAVLISVYNYLAEKAFCQNMIAISRFKLIMDKSTEGILIIKEQTIEYINDKFIEQQQYSINQVIIDN